MLKITIWSSTALHSCDMRCKRSPSMSPPRLSLIYQWQSGIVRSTVSRRSCHVKVHYFHHGDCATRPRLGIIATPDRSTLGDEVPHQSTIVDSGFYSYLLHSRNCSRSRRAPQPSSAQLNQRLPRQRRWPILETYSAPIPLPLHSVIMHKPLCDLCTFSATRNSCRMQELPSRSAAPKALPRFRGCCVTSRVL